MNVTTILCDLILPRRIIHTNSTITYASKTFVFPLQFAIGVSTNLLNLIVLNSPGMRTKTNNFLAAMALADFCFFLAMFPLSLSGHESLVTSVDYVKFYFYAHIPLVAFANWFSTASNWLMVMVTIERCTAVRFPLHSHIFWRRSRTLMLIATVFLVAFLLNSFQYVARKVTLRPMRFSTGDNSTLVNCTYTWEFVSERLEPRKFAYVRLSFYAVFFLSIVVPLVLLTALNSVLLHYLRKSGEQIGDKETSGRKDSRLLQERKVTLTVATIILGFVVFNLPGGVVQAYELINSAQLNTMTLSFYDLAELCNCLTISQKTANFFLYCFSSSAFRRRLFAVLFGKKKIRLSRRLAARIPYKTAPGSIKKAAKVDQLDPPESQVAEISEISDDADDTKFGAVDNVTETEQTTFL